MALPLFRSVSATFVYTPPGVHDPVTVALDVITSRTQSLEFEQFLSHGQHFSV